MDEPITIEHLMMAASAVAIIKNITDKPTPTKG